MSGSSTRPTLRSLLVLPSISSLILSSLLLSSSTTAYIPALPVNDTSGLNLTDASTIDITWTDPVSEYSGKVSYQLQADIPTGGRSSGALVHFTEATMGPNLTTSTPWIAYISCDVNETGSSMEWDIFTLARDRGAVSALLYTAKSQSCLLNPEYISDFEKPLDVFATKTVQVARVIDNQWAHTNDTFYYYNGSMLNASGTDINNSIANNAPLYRTFLIGTLTARNSTGQATATDIPNASPSGGSNGSRKGTPSSMIALYVITGVIASAFCLMVFVGARRALRHPERYGRREANDEQGPQSTAGGIAQAILDTFPVVKFSRGEQNIEAKRVSADGDINAIALPRIGRNNSAYAPHDQDGVAKSYYTSASGSSHSFTQSPHASGTMDDDDSFKPVGSAAPSTRASVHGQSRSIDGLAAMAQAEAAVDEQCPICLVDFETGDDLRVLPCEIGHVYHKACIDPWLLQVSSSCPLCRRDFNNPNPAPVTPPETQPSNTPPATSASDPPTQSGFARYLAFMRRDRNAQEGGDRERTRRPRAGTSATALSEEGHVGRGRRREADQTGPGGY